MPPLRSSYDEELARLAGWLNKRAEGVEEALKILERHEDAEAMHFAILALRDLRRQINADIRQADK